MTIDTKTVIKMKGSEYRKLVEALATVMDFIDLYEHGNVDYYIPSLFDDMYVLAAHVDNMECIEIVDD